MNNKQQFLEYLAHDCHCANATQTPEDRRAKYLIVLTLTRNPGQARRLRDWRWSSIARYFGYKNPKNFYTSLLTGVTK